MKKRIRGSVYLPFLPIMAVGLLLFIMSCCCCTGILGGGNSNWYGAICGGHDHCIVQDSACAPVCASDR